MGDSGGDAGESGDQWGSRYHDKTAHTAAVGGELAVDSGMDLLVAAGIETSKLPAKDPNIEVLRNQMAFIWVIQSFAGIKTEKQKKKSDK